VIDTASIDFGHDRLNESAVRTKIGEWNGLDVENFPTATYRGARWLPGGGADSGRG
jgi:hypothetical protein